MAHKKQKTNCSIGNQQQGFTLVEFMVASVLGLVVIAGAGSLYSYTKRLNDIGRARVAMLQDLRSAAAMIGQDARSAGTFGCASLGRRHAPDTDAIDATVGVNVVEGSSGINNKAVGLNALDTALVSAPSSGALEPAGPSAGVRWITQGNVSAALNSPANFTAKSGALLFTYGEGSLPWNDSSTLDTVQFNLDNRSQNKVVESIYNKGGYVVAAGCNALQVAYVAPGTTTASITLDGDAKAKAAMFNDASVTAPAGITEIDRNQDMILQRYKVVAYVVGELENGGNPVPDSEGLYRFEFGADGENWSAPQQLATNVSNMTAQYLFVTECPSALIPAGGAGAVNDQNYELMDAQNAVFGAAKEEAAGVYQGPASIHLKLTYRFPRIRGGSISSGDDTNHIFDIVATVRGGNVCASRKLANQ